MYVCSGDGRGFVPRDLQFQFKSVTVRLFKMPTLTDFKFRFLSYSERVWADKIQPLINSTLLLDTKGYLHRMDMKGIAVFCDTGLQAKDKMVPLFK